MLSRAAMLLFVLPGCHLVFPHASTDSADGPRPADQAADPRSDHTDSAEVDSARGDLARDLLPPDQGCPKQTLTAEADSCLSAADATGLYGTTTICNIGTGINSVGLFRFDLKSIATSTIQSITLTLTYAAADPGCGGTCASCDGIEHAGTLVLTHMRSDWNEASVTWNHRAYQDPTLGTASWSAPGATGPADRGESIATIAHAAKDSAVFDSGTNPQMLTGLASWRVGNKISFQVQPTNNAVFIAAMRQQPSTKCSTGFAKPSLEIRSCP